MTVHRGITALALPSRPAHLLVVSGHITHFADPHDGRSWDLPVLAHGNSVHAQAL